MPEKKKNRFLELLFGTNNFFSIIPGLIIVIIVTVAAYYLNLLLEFLIPSGKSPVSMILLAIIIGIIIRNVIKLPAILNNGINFAIKKILKLGIIIMGIRLSIFELMRIAGVSIVIVIICISAGLAFTIFIARKINLPPRLGMLIAVGSSICGASAIVALAPGIEAEDEEVTYAIATITIFGIIAMFAYPYLAHLIFDLNTSQAGIFIGTAIHETAQVTGAGIIYDQLWIESNTAVPTVADIAVVTKLVRNTFMVIVLPLVVLINNRNKTYGKDNSKKSLNILSVFPMFIIGFIVMALIRTLGDQVFTRSQLLWNPDSWNILWSSLKNWSGYLLAVAMAGVGLNTDFKKIKRLGSKPFFIGLLAAFFIGAISLLLVITLRSFLSFI